METPEKAVQQAPSDAAERQPHLRERTGSVRIGYQQQSVGLPFLFQAASTGAYILGILFIFKRNGNFAISLPFYT